MAKIAVIGLGGTIAMRCGPAGLQPALGVADMLEGLVPDGIECVPRDLAQVPSANLGWADLGRIRDLLRELRGEGVSGAVLVQGTDTLEETAFALDLLLEPALPVVFTGAMRAPSQLGAEGPANLAAALQVAASAPAALGVLVVMNDEVHAARHVRKAHTTSVAAFTSGDLGPLGRLHEGRLRLWGEALPRLPRIAPAAPLPTPLAKVALQTLVMDGEADLLARLPELGYRGCVVEAMGAGHAPRALVPVLADLAARMPVVLCSRTGSGRVCEATYGYAGAETDLLARGLIPGGGLTGLKARIALQLCLAAPGAPAELFGAIAQAV